MRFIRQLQIAFLCIFFSCKYDNVEDIHPFLYCDTSVVFTFTNDIRPLFIQSCGAANSSCHGDGSLQINLNEYEEVRDAAEDGDISGVITHAPGFVPMPKDLPKLDECRIHKIQNWINRNMPQ